METSGAYPYSGDFDWICLSPKKMQAPLEEISRQDYEVMVKSVKPITNCEVNEEDIKGSFECATGACPIK